MGGVERGGLKASRLGGRLLCLRGEQKKKQKQKQKQKRIPPAPLLQRGEAIGGVRRLRDGSMAFVDAVIAASKTSQISKTLQAPEMFQTSKMVQTSKQFQASRMFRVFHLLKISPMSSALQTRRFPPFKPVLFPSLQKGGRGDSLLPLPLLLPSPSAPTPNTHRPRGSHP